MDDLLYVCSYPPQNVKVAINSIERQGGGPACTAMAAVGTLYGRAAYAARLGTDDLSLYIEESLKRRRVDTSHIVREARAAPYHSFIVVDRDGSRNVFYDRSKYIPLMEEDLSAALIQSAELVLLDHVADPALIEVARKVHDLKVPIVADVEGRSEPARRLASMADHLIVPEEFALWASGSHDVRAACACLAQTRRLSTIVTCGSRGCYYSLGPERPVTHFPAFSVEPFDTTGCGDTFHGAFALAVARNFSLFEAVAFASAAAALKAFGARGIRKGWNALPTLDEIILFLRSSRPDCESELLDKIYHLRSDQVA